VIDQALRELSYHPQAEFEKFCVTFDVVADYAQCQDRAIQSVWTPKIEFFDEVSCESWTYTSAPDPTPFTQIMLSKRFDCWDKMMPSSRYGAARLWLDICIGDVAAGRVPSFPTRPSPSGFRISPTELLAGGFPLGEYVFIAPKTNLVTWAQFVPPTNIVMYPEHYIISQSGGVQGGANLRTLHCKSRGGDADNYSITLMGANGAPFGIAFCQPTRRTHSRKPVIRSITTTSSTTTTTAALKRSNDSLDSSESEEEIEELTVTSEEWEEFQAFRALKRQKTTSASVPGTKKTVSE